MFCVFFREGENKKPFSLLLHLFILYFCSVISHIFRDDDTFHHVVCPSFSQDGSRNTRIFKF